MNIEIVVEYRESILKKLERTNTYTQLELYESGRRTDKELKKLTWKINTETERGIWTRNGNVEFGHGTRAWNLDTEIERGIWTRK